MIKKVFSTLAITLIFTIPTLAQSHSDGFFCNSREVFRNEDVSAYQAPETPGVAPVGDGLLVLSVLGAGFVALKRNK